MTGELFEKGCRCLASINRKRIRPQRVNRNQNDIAGCAFRCLRLLALAASHQQCKEQEKNKGNNSSRRKPAAQPGRLRKKMPTRCRRYICSASFQLAFPFAGILPAKVYKLQYRLSRRDAGVTNRKGAELRNGIVQESVIGTDASALSIPPGVSDSSVRTHKEAYNIGG